MEVPVIPVVRIRAITKGMIAVLATAVIKQRSVRLS